VGCNPVLFPTPRPGGPRAQAQTPSLARHFAEIGDRPQPRTDRRLAAIL